MKNMKLVNSGITNDGNAVIHYHYTTTWIERIAKRTTIRSPQISTSPTGIYSRLKKQPSTKQPSTLLQRNRIFKTKLQYLARAVQIFCTHNTFADRQDKQIWRISNNNLPLDAEQRKQNIQYDFIAICIVIFIILFC